MRLLATVLVAAVLLSCCSSDVSALNPPCYKQVVSFAEQDHKSLYLCLGKSCFMNLVSRNIVTDEAAKAAKLDGVCDVIAHSLYYGLTGELHPLERDMFAPDYVPYKYSASLIQPDDVDRLRFMSEPNTVHQINFNIAHSDSRCGDFHALLAVRWDTDAGEEYVSVYQGYRSAAFTYLLAEYMRGEAPNFGSFFDAQQTVPLKTFLDRLRRALTPAEESAEASVDGFESLTLCRPAGPLRFESIRAFSAPLKVDDDSGMCNGFFSMSCPVRTPVRKELSALEAVVERGGGDDDSSSGGSAVRPTHRSTRWRKAERKAKRRFQDDQSARMKKSAEQFLAGWRHTPAARESPKPALLAEDDLRHYALKTGILPGGEAREKRSEKLVDKTTGRVLLVPRRQEERGVVIVPREGTLPAAALGLDRGGGGVPDIAFPVAKANNPHKRKVRGDEEEEEEEQDDDRMRVDGPEPNVRRMQVDGADTDEEQQRANKRVRKGGLFQSGYQLVKSGLGWLWNSLNMEDQSEEN